MRITCQSWEPPFVTHQPPRTHNPAKTALDSPRTNTAATRSLRSHQKEPFYAPSKPDPQQAVKWPRKIVFGEPEDGLWPPQSSLRPRRGPGRRSVGPKRWINAGRARKKPGIVLGRTKPGHRPRQSPKSLRPRRNRAIRPAKSPVSPKTAPFAPQSPWLVRKRLGNPKTRGYGPGCAGIGRLSALGAPRRIFGKTAGNPGPA